MSGKPIIAYSVTQEPQAVDSLAAYLQKQISSDGVLDLGDTKLIRSNRGDAYYAVTAKSCSCPSFIYRGGPCKHQRKLFSQSTQSKPASYEPLIKRGGFRPVSEDEERAISSPIVAKMLIDCHDTTMRDLPYWQAKQAQEA